MLYLNFNLNSGTERTERQNVQRQANSKERNQKEGKKITFFFDFISMGVQWLLLYF